MSGNQDFSASQGQTRGVVRHNLANGLTLLVEPLRHAPVVALQAWVHVGAADEDKDHDAGLAHLHEHMLFKGTKRRGVGEVARAVEAAGGEINAWTSHDDTAYHMVMGRADCALGLDLLADVLSSSTFDATELAREKEVVLEEIRRAQDSPARRMSSALFDLAFGTHPYRHPVLGTSESVSATEQANMLAFFHRHYRPDNTTLLVVGDVAPEEVIDQVEQIFGGWQPHPQSGERPRKTQRRRAKEPVHTELVSTVLAEDVQDARLSIAWAAPEANHADTAALDLFAVLLGHGDSSRLHEGLVMPRHVRDAYASCYTPRDTGLLFLGATLNLPRPQGADVLAAVERLVGAAQRLAEQPPSAQEMEKARSLTLADAAYSRQTMEGQARKRGFYEATCGDYAHEETYLEAVRKLDAATISEVARRYLAAAPAVILQLPADAPASALKLAPSDFAQAIRHAQTTGGAATVKVLKRTKGEHGFVRLQLDGGPTLLVRQQPGGTVAMRAIGPGGQRWEQRDQAGLGVLCASVWGQATHDRPPGALASQVARMGGELSAFCGRNTVGLAGEFITERADEGLALFLEALWSPRFADEDVARERFAMGERIRAKQDSPGALASELFAQTLYANHPYGLSPLGTAQTLANLSTAQVASYHARHTDPRKMVISVVGPMAAEPLAEAIMAAIAKWRGERQDDNTLAAAPPGLTEDAPPTSPQSVTRALAKQQTHVLVGSLGTCFDADDRFALEVLCAVLSGQSGRLFLDLRDQQSLAYSLSAGSAEGIEPGLVLVHMACSPDKKDRALKGVHGHLQQLIDTPVPQQELARARQVLVGGHAIDLQRPGAQALSAATGELYGLGFEAFAKVADRVLAVTAADVQRVAATYLNKQRRIEVMVGPS